MHYTQENYKDLWKIQVTSLSFLPGFPDDSVVEDFFFLKKKSAWNNKVKLQDWTRKRKPTPSEFNLKVNIRVWNKKDGGTEREKGSCHAYNQATSRLNPNWEEYLKNK